MYLIQVRAAYRAAASGRFDWCSAYGAVGGRNPPPLTSASMKRSVVESTHAYVATPFLTDPSEPMIAMPSHIDWAIVGRGELY
jgi:hypothetical protein